jgi:hypothetical protein
VSLTRTHVFNLLQVKFKAFHIKRYDGNLYKDQNRHAYKRTCANGYFVSENSQQTKPFDEVELWFVTVVAQLLYYSVILSFKDSSAAYV